MVIPRKSNVFFWKLVRFLKIVILPHKLGVGVLLLVNYSYKKHANNLSQLSEMIQLILQPSCNLLQMN